MKMEKQLMSLSILVIVAMLVISSAFFTVTEGSRSLVIRIGEFVSNDQNDPIIYYPGLHFKIPIIDRVININSKIQSFNEKSTRILTKEQKPVEVDYYVKWKVTDFVRYYRAIAASGTSGQNLASRLANPSKAENFLKNTVADVLRSIFGDRNLHDIISGERMDIMNTLQEKSDVGAKSFGISIVDVRIKTLDYPPEISNSVFDRMRTKREQVANRYRANGKSAEERIRSDAEKEVAITLATAEKDAAEFALKDLLQQPRSTRILTQRTRSF